MKNILSSFAAKIFALALPVVFALPLLAHAEGQKGKFTLTNETHWGPAVLVPGDYDFVLDSSSNPARVVVRESTGRVAALLISTWSSEDSAIKGNGLVLETHGNEAFVNALCLSNISTELHFALPKIKEDIVAHEVVKAAPSSAMATSVE